jgi:thiomorpholine-carboxylate dehydrogenase
MYIGEEDVRKVLTYEALIPAVREALVDFSAGRVIQPARTILRAGNAEGAKNGWFAVMPVVHGDYMAVKTVTFFPGNADLGLHTHLAVIELLRRATGEPLALMDGRLITEMRTAAVSAVALDALAGPDVKSLGVFGSGVQARAHLEALRLVRPGLADIRVWSRNGENAESLVRGFLTPRPQERDLGHHPDVVRAASAEEAAGCDVVLAVTSSPEPVVMGRWLKPECLVLAVGAVGPQLRELDDEAARSCWVVAESTDAVGREAGDIVLSGAPIRAEIGGVLSGADALPQPRPVRILFKSVGMAIEDLTAARLVWEARNGA